jgi:GNAT superfamily N-acetyltransferase
VSDLTGITVRTATLEDLEEVTGLFDGYRVFYKQTSDRERARRFIRNRLEQKDSVIFLAVLEERAVGFVQMYPSFSSVATARIWILNDLYVYPEARRRGVGKALVGHAVHWGRRQKAFKLVLETAVDNRSGQLMSFSNRVGQYRQFVHGPQYPGPTAKSRSVGQREPTSQNDFIDFLQIVDELYQLRRRCF